jgi:poly-D-alanine transfer protein DltD
MPKEMLAYEQEQYWKTKRLNAKAVAANRRLLNPPSGTLSKKQIEKIAKDKELVKLYTPIIKRKAAKKILTKLEKIRLEELASVVVYKP